MKNIFLISLLFVSSSFAGSEKFYDYAKVKYSEPIYEYKYDQQKRQKCEEVRYRVDNYDNRNYSSNKEDNSLGIDTLIGTAAGTIIGSQIGGGNGRVAAQIVGGLLGAKVAHEIRNNYKPDYNSNTYNARYDDNYRYETKTECYDIVDKGAQRKVITGYKNYFVYNGREHYKITNQPTNQVKVTHSISF